ncbi:SDR family NAD(P)-dependent oxidoreductase [Roseomonas sp. JC162]|uniref:SDR family NAD(P)-dependent oxidoreductase n=1 Tax=Neoroseomonas marina TaxID=1232220 RepID=A0A848ECA1_9PROT|nr:SDR family NAD(P)-dependent oxidoreductase [Neoroseomonas marina]NMJ42141.1 SDR family NAD(P)-dependent oxidoreductase [Neoroseomonas marina]
MSAPRCVLISGASRGLGAALAERFAAPGVTLRLVARGAEGLAATAARCVARGAIVETAAIDVRDGAALGAQVLAWDAASPIDCVVANAGISRGVAPDGAWEGAEGATAQVAVNLIGAMHLIEPLLPEFRARGVGRIVVVASVAAYRGLPDAPGYAASKAGLRAYGEGLRAALAPRGVGVTVVLPGFFDSAMGARWKGPRPLAMGLDRAADITHRAILRGARRCAFPLALAALLRVVDALPAGLSDWAVRRMRFRIAPEA